MSNCIKTNKHFNGEQSIVLQVPSWNQGLHLYTWNSARWALLYLLTVLSYTAGSSAFWGCLHSIVLRAAAECSCWHHL